jgi:hypothetical protein
MENNLEKKAYIVFFLKKHYWESSGDISQATSFDQPGGF